MLQKMHRHSMIWRMCMSVTLESAVFMGKNYLNKCHSIVNTTDLTLEQMFDVSTGLVSEQNEISSLETAGWDNHSWKHLSLIGEERVISLQRTKVHVFSDSVLCLGKIFDPPPQSNDAWERTLGWLQSSWKYRNFDWIDGEPMEFEWNIFQGLYVAAQCRSQTFTVYIRWDTREFHRKNHTYVDVQRYFLWIKKTMKKNVWQMLDSYLCTREDLEKVNGRLSVLVLRRSGTVSMKTVHKENGTILLKGWWNSQKADVQFSALRALCPEVNSKKQRTWTTVHTLCSRPGNGWDYFSHNCFCKPAVFTEQSRRFVKSMNPFTRERRDPLWWSNRVAHSCSVWSRQEAPLDCDDPVNQDLLLHQHGEWLEKLSQQDRLSKFCMDAGFLNAVEIGKYFMTKDTGDLTQRHAAACREYTLPREDGSRVGSHDQLFAW